MYKWRKKVKYEGESATLKEENNKKKIKANRSIHNSTKMGLKCMEVRKEINRSCLFLFLGECLHI